MSNNIGGSVLPSVQPVPTRTCLGCGVQIPSMYTVCPYCRFDPTARKRGQGAPVFVAMISMLAGIFWLSSAVGLLSIWTSMMNYPPSYYHPRPIVSYFYGGVLLHVSGILSIIVGLLAYKREHYWPIMALNVTAGVIGAAVGYALMNVALGEVMLINVVAMLVLLFYKEEFAPKATQNR